MQRCCNATAVIIGVEGVKYERSDMPIRYWHTLDDTGPVKYQSG